MYLTRAGIRHAGSGPGIAKTPNTIQLIKKKEEEEK
jgi:hypothetical protein